MSEILAEKPQGREMWRKKILNSMKHTMTHRASTNTKFNAMLSSLQLLNAGMKSQKSHIIRIDISQDPPKRDISEGAEEGDLDNAPPPPSLSLSLSISLCPCRRVLLHSSCQLSFRYPVLFSRTQPSFHHCMPFGRSHLSFHRCMLFSRS